MPMATVHYVRDALTPEQKTELGEKLTHVLLTIEGGQDTPGGRTIAWVMFNAYERADWYVGGSTGDEYVSAAGKFLVVVTVPEGSMNAERKSMVHRAVNDVFLELTATAGEPGAGRSIWVQVAEIPEGHWGTSGKTAGVLGIARIAGVPSDSPLLDYVRGYLDAKARSLDLADYPPDIAGRAVVRT